MCTENGRVQVTFTYPSATLAGVVAAAGVVQVNGTPTAAQLLVDNYQAVVGGGAMNFRVLGGPTPANCAFTYTASPGLGQAPTLRGFGRRRLLRSAGTRRPPAVGGRLCAGHCACVVTPWSN